MTKLTEHCCCPQVSKTWPIRNGLLFERAVTPEIVDLSKTPSKKYADV